MQRIFLLGSPKDHFFMVFDSQGIYIRIINTNIIYIAYIQASLAKQWLFCKSRLLRPCGFQSQGALLFGAASDFWDACYPSRAPIVLLQSKDRTPKVHKPIHQFPILNPPTKTQSHKCSNPSVPNSSQSSKEPFPKPSVPLAQKNRIRYSRCASTKEG